MNKELKVIDISAWQPPNMINYDKLASQIDGVILRACYGTAKDTAFETHHREFIIRGVKVGAYHYIVGGVNIQAQVTAFRNAILGKTLENGLWMDIEDTRVGSKLKPTEIIEYAKLVPEAGIYTSYYKWLEIMGNKLYANLNKRLLWVAHYTTAKKPLMPYGWDKYRFWQYSETGKLDGYSGYLDLNRVGTSNAEFKIYLPIVTVPKPEPVETPNTPKPLWQQNPEWKDIKLGYSPSITIGQQGCLITSLAMILQLYGLDETPKTVNKKLQDNGGFMAGKPNMYWKIPPNIWGITYDYYREPWFNKANLKDIDEFLAKDTPVLVHVDLDLETYEVEQHWVLLTKKVGNNDYINDYLCWDSWRGDEVLFSERFGKPENGIYRVCVYSKK